MLLNQTLRDLNSQGLAKMPPTAKAILQTSLRELLASGLAEKALQVGQKVPDGVLPNAFGQKNSHSGSLCPGAAGDQLLPGKLVPLLQFGIAGPTGHLARTSSTGSSIGGHFTRIARSQP